VLCSLMHQGKGGYSQSFWSSTPASSLKSATRDVSFLQSDSKVSAIREQPVKRYSEVFGLAAEGQGFVVKLTFNSC